MLDGFKFFEQIINPFAHRSTWDERSEQTWLNAAMLVKDLLVQYGITEVGVEIIDPLLQRKIYKKNLEYGHPFHQIWFEIRHEFMEVIKQDQELYHCYIITFLQRFGYSQIPEENAITIEIILWYYFDFRKCASVQRKMEDLIKHYQGLTEFAEIADLEIQILFESGYEEDWGHCFD